MLTALLAPDRIQPPSMSDASLPASPRAPRVLLFARQPYALTPAKLPRALRLAGCEVAALGVRHGLLARTRHLDRFFLAHTDARRLLVDLDRACRTWRPELLIPGDMWSVHYLRSVARSRLVRLLRPALCRLIERSIGRRGGYGVVDSKFALLRLAETLGAPAPSFRIVARPDWAAAFARGRYPVVVKSEYNYGSGRVAVCRSEDELERELGALLREGSPGALYSARGLKHAVAAFPFAPPPDRFGRVGVQAFVEGPVVSYSFVALGGRVLGGNAAEKLHPHPEPTSPACVYRSVSADVAAPLATVSARLVEATGLAGFGCFDYIVSEETGEPHLLECNPLAVNVAHLGHRFGTDLCARLRSALVAHPGEEPRAGGQASHQMEARAVALFPTELLRDPESPYLRGDPCDVPFDDGELLEAICDRFGLDVGAAERLRRPESAPAGLATQCAARRQAS